MDIYHAKLFGWKCPYTNKPCKDWNCSSCEVNQQEREWLKEMDEDEGSAI